jgi:hypothetical protein
MILNRLWGVEFPDYNSDKSAVYLKILFHYISVLVLFSFMNLNFSDYIKILKFQGDPV